MKNVCAAFRDPRPLRGREPGIQCRMKWWKACGRKAKWPSWPSVRRTQEPMITSNGASLNVVAVAILLGAIAAGGGGQRGAAESDSGHRHDSDRPADGDRRRRSRSSGSAPSCCASAATSGCAARLVLDRAVHRQGVVGDRSAHHRLRLCRRADAHRRYGAGQRRCGVCSGWCHDAGEGALEVQDYARAVAWAAQRRCATSSAGRRLASS
jgi:hypothetical protein